MKKMRHVSWITVMILFFVLSSAFVLGQVSSVYEAKIMYSNGDLNLRSLNVKSLETPPESFGPYVAQIMSFDGVIITKTNFNVPNKKFFDMVDPETGEITGGYMEILNQTNFTLNIPYYPNAKEIVLYDPNSIEKLRIDVSMFAKEIPEVEKRVTSKLWFWTISIGILLLIFWISLKMKNKDKQQKLAISFFIF